MREVGVVHGFGLVGPEVVDGVAFRFEGRLEGELEGEAGVVGGERDHVEAHSGKAKRPTGRWRQNIYDSIGLNASETGREIYESAEADEIETNFPALHPSKMQASL